MKDATYQGTKILATLALAAMVTTCSESPEPKSYLAVPGGSASNEPDATKSARGASMLNEPLDPKLSKALEFADEEEAEDPGKSKFGDGSAFRMKGQENAMAQQIAELPESDAREFALTELMRQWASYDLEKALEYGWAKFAEDPQLRRAFLKGTMPALARVDPYRVLEVIEGGDWWHDLWKDQREALRQIERSDFDHSKAFFLKTVPGRQHKEEAYRYAHRIGEEQDYQAALVFADELKQPIAKAWATRAAVTRWVESDSLAASDYVNQTNDPEIRNHAILGLIDGIWQTNPQETMVWAREISDPEVRAHAHSLLASRWQRQEQTQNVELLLRSLSGNERTAVETALAEMNAQ